MIFQFLEADLEAAIEANLPAFLHAASARMKTPQLLGRQFGIPDCGIADLVVIDTTPSDTNWKHEIDYASEGQANRKDVRHTRSIGDGILETITETRFQVGRLLVIEVKREQVVDKDIAQLLRYMTGILMAHMHLGLHLPFDWSGAIDIETGKAMERLVRIEGILTAPGISPSALTTIDALSQLSAYSTNFTGFGSGRTAFDISFVQANFQVTPRFGSS